MNAIPMGIAAAPTRFQRSEGAIRIGFRRRDAVTVAARVYQRGAMKVRFPNPPQPDEPEAVLVNICGGLTGGDRIGIEVDLEAGARATIATQACEKIYRSLEGDAAVRATLRLADAAALDWLPQPTILFDRARLRRETLVAMPADARLLAVEANIFGRAAMREDMQAGALHDRFEVLRDGRLITADIFRLDGDIAATLDRPAVLAGARAMATIRLIAPEAAAWLEPAREFLTARDVQGGASAWDDMLVIRLVAPDGYTLTAHLTALVEQLRGRAMPRCWRI